MNRMMKLAVFAVGVEAMLSFAGCGAKGPDAVALDFMQKFSSGQVNLEYLTKNCTEDTAKMFSLAWDEVDKDEVGKEIRGATFKVTNTEIKGDKAVVSIEQTDADKKTKTDSRLDLVKVDGNWRVDYMARAADACVTNMKNIQVAYEMAMMGGQTVKRVSDLCGEKGYIKVEPQCPLGGKYKIDENGNITCPSGAKGHVLPQ